MSDLKAMTIGELSRRTGCNIETVRYYERIGLMPPAPRTAGRYRLYGDDDVRRLAFVRRARALGFAVDDVRTLLSLAREPRAAPCAEAREVATAHLAAVRVKIADLRAMERLLDDAVARCATGGDPCCPIIETLAETPLAAVRKSTPPKSGAAARRRRG